MTIESLSRIRAKLDLYERLMRLDKPIGTLLLLWPTLWALWFSASGAPDWMLAWVFMLGTLLMRSAGCIINDLADRNFDPHVARTKDRPLAAGKVSVKEALLLFSMLVILAFCLVLSYMTPRFLLLCIAALFLAVTYPLTKRFFAVPQAYLGIAFGFGIPLAYEVQLGTIPLEAWLLLLANVFWALAYDTEYAMTDREDDLKIGIKTSAITFGRFDVMAVMFCYGATLFIIGAVGYTVQRGPLFYVGLVAAALLALYHFTLIRKRDPGQCFKAFLHNNWLGAAIFAGIALDYYSNSFKP